MAIYLWNLFGIFIWYIFFRLTIKNRQKRNKYLLFMVSIQFILIAALRGVTVGADTKNYLSIYKWCQSFDFSNITHTYMEPGYVLLNKIVDIMFGNYQMLLTIVAIWIYLFIAYFMYKTTDSAFVPLMLFVCIGYFTSSMNIIRQYLGLAFVLMCYLEIIWNKKIKKGFIWLAIGFLFHDSVIVVVPIILLYFVLTSETLKSKNLLKFICIVMGLFLVLGMNELIRIIDAIGIKSVSNLSEQVSSSGLSSILIKLLFTLVYVYSSRRIKDSEEKYQLDFLNYCNIVSIFVNLIAFKAPLLGRFNVYFALLLVIFIPKVIDVTFYKKSNRFIAYAAIVLLFMGSYIHDLPTSDVVPWIMYESVK